MNIVNLTGEAVFLCGRMLPGGNRKRKAYVEASIQEIGTAEWKGVSIPLLESTQGNVINLPDPAPDTIYIVKGLVAGEAGLTLDREDVYTLSRTDPDGQAHALIRIKGAYEDE